MNSNHIRTYVLGLLTAAFVLLLSNMASANCTSCMYASANGGLTVIKDGYSFVTVPPYVGEHSGALYTYYGMRVRNDFGAAVVGFWRGASGGAEKYWIQAIFYTTNGSGIDSSVSASSLVPVTPGDVIDLYLDNEGDVDNGSSTTWYAEAYDETSGADTNEEYVLPGPAFSYIYGQIEQQNNTSYCSQIPPTVTFDGITWTAGTGWPFSPSWGVHYGITFPSCAYNINVSTESTVTFTY